MPIISRNGSMRPIAIFLIIVLAGVAIGLAIHFGTKSSTNTTNTTEQVITKEESNNKYLTQRIVVQIEKNNNENKKQLNR